jgi:crotonobetainyl-CoA:carnitine CoA-transferase CaiB-like acyl-CoA transferase
MPFGLATADMLAGAYLVQGILACLVRRGRTGEGGIVEVNLLESVLDYQFEVLTTHLNDGGKLPQRSAVNNAHAYLAAPYGIYSTGDGYLALAMGSVTRLGELLHCPALLDYSDPQTWFTQRDEIKGILADHLKTQTTVHWLSLLEPADIWCSDVFAWPQLLQHEGFKVLDMIQLVSRDNGASLLTTRCPIRVDGQIYKSCRGAPRIGEHTDEIVQEYAL